LTFDERSVVRRVVATTSLVENLRGSSAQTWLCETVEHTLEVLPHHRLGYRCRAKRAHLKRLLPESQGHNLAYMCRIRSTAVPVFPAARRRGSARARDRRARFGGAPPPLVSMYQRMSAFVSICQHVSACDSIWPMSPRECRLSSSLSLLGGGAARRRGSARTRDRRARFGGPPPTVELIPTLGALSPPGGPVQDPVHPVQPL